LPNLRAGPAPPGLITSHAASPSANLRAGPAPPGLITSHAASFFANSLIGALSIDRSLFLLAGFFFSAQK
jgi:hypothetical protein